ncbi:NAD(P)-binding domain-containing protein, partial [Chloroflexi bacterium TSY]|nr:NAD(P)-binding domain-containing protein [Chloroflexi bacterium TSY]
MNTPTDYLIIGAGPAGLQLGYFFEKAGRDYQIIEASDAPGASFKKFPRHRTLISINKVYTGSEDPEFNMRADWNSLLSDSKDLLFGQYSKRFFPPADRFVEYLKDYAEHYNLNIKYQTKIARISKQDGLFHLLDSNGEVHTCRHLIVATGISKPYIPDIPGIELTENYATVSVDPEQFTNQKVLIIGKGNSAFETADNLIETTATIHVASPNSVTMAWKTHYVGNLRAVNNNILDTYQLKAQNAILDATIDKIEKQDGKYHVYFSYAHAEGDTDVQVYDSVITCTGFRFDNSIFDESCRPELAINDRFPKQTSEWESTNVQNLYFTGVLTHMRDYKKTASAFIHGFRYNARALYHILDKKHHNNEWPHRELVQTPDALTEAIIERVNRTSALWQQFGFICDLVVVPHEETPQQGAQIPTVRYFEDVPVDYVHESEFSKQTQYYTITLEYGPFHDEVDPFNVNRIAQTNAEEAGRSIYLHPVIRRYQQGELLDEQHLVENLENEWNRDVHVNPLNDFFRRELRSATLRNMTRQQGSSMGGE